jgi:predicted small secreted protein
MTFVSGGCFAALVVAAATLAGCNSPPTLGQQARAAGWDDICREWHRVPSKPHMDRCVDTVWFCPDTCQPVSGLRVVRLEEGLIP